MKKLIYIFAAIVALGFTACDKDNSIDTNQFELQDQIDGVYVKNGILHFVDSETFFQKIKEVSEMEQTQRQQWEQNLGFVSLSTEIENVMNQISECDSQEAVNRILDVNNDIVYIKNDMFTSRIPSNTYQNIVNRAGIFYVGNVIHKVFEDVVLSTEEGTIEELNVSAIKMKNSSNRLRTVGTTAQESNINIYKYIETEDDLFESGENGKLRASPNTCGSYRNAYVKGNDRRCHFEMWTNIIYCQLCCSEGYTQQIVVEIKTTHEIKNMWGNYKSFSQTTGSIRNVAFTVDVPVITGFDGYRTQYYYSNRTIYISSATGSREASSHQWTYTCGEPIRNGNLHAGFYRVRGQGGNRGITNWADINCGAW